MPNFEPGSVWVVGAGPGDPGLLSLLALHGIQNADVIVYDALVSDDILKFSGENAELEYAGKRGGKPSPKQKDITDSLVALAHAGKRVLRLKGGDPFVFGRGAEPDPDPAVLRSPARMADPAVVRCPALEQPDPCRPGQPATAAVCRIGGA